MDLMSGNPHLIHLHLGSPLRSLFLPRSECLSGPLKAARFYVCSRPYVLVLLTTGAFIVRSTTVRLGLLTTGTFNVIIWTTY